MFEDLKANIEILERRRDVSVEDLIDSMCKLFDGVEVSGDAIFDVTAYGNALVNLFDRILPTYRNNRNVIEKLSKSEIGEDLNDVMASSKEIEARLSDVRTLLKTLVQERKRFQALELEYEEENQKKLDLERALSQLRDISPDEIKKLNIELEKEKERRKKHEELFEEAQRRVNIEKTGVDDLIHKKKKCETERQALEDEKATLQTSISDYEHWENKHKEEIHQMRERCVESKAKLDLVRNAWSSVKGQWDLPERVNASNAFVQSDKNIHSFSDLEHWIETRGEEIEQAVSEYSDMYRAFLDIFKETKQ